ncbi:VWA domain-containing protein [bacterium]|nr:VWA domain-containing protein [bacterium]
MKLVTFILSLALAGAAFGKTEAPPRAEQPVDLVICLDTSGSMSGLIEAAKQKLWDIVNELGRARPKPHLRVALYAYGTPGYGADSGYVRQLIALTDDLDAVYAQLTPLRTNGGSEYVARVVRASVLEQPWSPAPAALKIIVVAGNEPATQDPEYDSLAMAREAITAGIIVNTIYCGGPANRDANGWRAVARAADGQFASIDQDRGTVVVSTPFDQKLAELSGTINRTYVGYGAGALLGVARQAEADSASLIASPAAAAGRAAAKASGQYRNARWDLVDAREQVPEFDLAKLKDEELPRAMQKLTLDERRAYLEQKAKERRALQEEIQQLNEKRQQYIADEMKKTGKTTDQAFDAAMLRAIREQATTKQFRFE